jgi:hypothetical protein
MSCKSNLITVIYLNKNDELAVGRNVSNTVFRAVFTGIPTIKEENRRYSSQYSARLRAHPNDLIVNLMELPDNRRLRRHLPNDLPTRFLV